jgi:hypothetical protein
MEDVKAVMSVVLFVAVTVGITLGLLRVGQRWPHFLRRSCLLFAGLGVLSFGVFMFELWLLQHTGFYLHLHPYLLTFFGLFFFALALLAGVALLCGFCLRQLHERRKT